MNTEQIFQAFSGNDKFGRIDEYIGPDFENAPYVKVPVERLNISNPKGFDISGSFIWCTRPGAHSLHKVKVEVISDSPNCTFYFLRFPSRLSIKLNGPGHSVLNFSAKTMAINLRMTGGQNEQFRGSKVIIGEKTFIGGARAVLLNTDLIIKRNGLWSDEILVQGSNQHGIIDRKTMSLIDYGRNRIVLEPHVWIARRATLMSGARIGAGSILGTSALASKSYPPSCIIAGNPGRVIKRNRTWTDTLHEIRADDLDLIDERVPLLERSRWPEIIRPIWLKAAAAGALGAAAFDGLQEIAAVL